MRKSLGLFFLFINLFCYGQKKEIDFDSPDSLYREDQFYLGLSYSNLQNAPQGFDQVKISSNVVFGFLRDMPFNKNRTWSFAPGLGYRISVLNHNIGITNNGISNSYSILSSEYTKNKQIIHYVEVPLELRWRASTPESHKFWRIYSGFKLSYLIFDQYKFEGLGERYKQTNNSDIEKLQYGAYLSAGWNTWNAYIYYGLNPIFKSAEINGNQIKMNTFNVGLIFYIL